MVPKTERFEMRFETDTLDTIDAWRSRQPDVPSRSEAARRLIEKGLAGDQPGQFSPTRVERLMLWMMAEMLKQQKGSEVKDTATLVQDAIYGGHFWALDWQLTGILHEHADDPKAVTDVVDALDMWSFIERAYAKFSDEDKDRIEKEVGPTGRSPHFFGYDGNNESTHMGIAQFLVQKLDRFQEFKGRSFNSHMPTVATYRRMSAIFEPIRMDLVGRELSVDDVIRLLKREKEGERGRPTKQRDG